LGLEGLETDAGDLVRGIQADGLLIGFPCLLSLFLCCVCSAEASVGLDKARINGEGLLTVLDGSIKLAFLLVSSSTNMKK
jgi:hypothetical protein